MLKWRVLAAVIFGLLGLLLALWINQGATARDAAETARQCGPAPVKHVAMDDRTRLSDYDYCAATVRNKMEY